MAHIVIPMSGEGRRFLDAGYDRPKPLVPVDGNPMIEYVLSMFPGESKFTFILSRAHAGTNLPETLLRLKPHATIRWIDPHKKGPVWAVLQCLDLIDDDEEVIVNYCDFYSYWDYEDFLSFCRERNTAGCVPSYKGFHPHMLGSDNYAFIRDSEQWLMEIQEKRPFTANRMQEFASNGTYYFSKGVYVKTYFKRLVERRIEVNGEYYVSMVYNLLVEDKLPVSVYEVQHMLQWGTPLDLEEYQMWSSIFSKAVTVDRSKPPSLGSNSVVLLPMAGEGNRFKQAGIKTPKPLLNVSGHPMFVQATRSLPEGERYVFVCLREHLTGEVKRQLNSIYSQASIVLLEGITRGQAESCALGLLMASPPVARDAALIVGACDNGMLLNRAAAQSAFDNKEIDAIAFTFRLSPASRRRPEAYGWVAIEGGGDKACSVSVKKPISGNPAHDHAIVGTFYFRQVDLFLKAFDTMVARNIQVNGEFYVDSLFGVLIELGYDCRVFEVDAYIGWGTPDDWNTFRYWQSFFHKCSWHPYRIDLDPNANAGDPDLRAQVEHRITQSFR